jgi:hypothetical protein
MIANDFFTLEAVEHFEDMSFQPSAIDEKARLLITENQGSSAKFMGQLYPRLEGDARLIGY